MYFLLSHGSKKNQNQGGEYDSPKGWIQKEVKNGAINISLLHQAGLILTVSFYYKMQKERDALDTLQDEED